MVNTILDGRPYLIVNWVDVWVVWRSKAQRNKVWLLSTQKFDSFTSALCRCTVLLTRVNGIDFMIVFSQKVNEYY